MAPVSLERSSKKRKLPVLDSIPPPTQELPEDVGLEMQSEDEEEELANGQGEGELEEGSDDGIVDEFPEIYSGSSDNDEAEDEESGSGTEEEEDEEDISDKESSLEDASDDAHPFPRPKTIISDITGQPKRIYPEIEPNYDSDSSTEEVRQSCYLFLLKRMIE